MLRDSAPVKKAARPLRQARRGRWSDGLAVLLAVTALTADAVPAGGQEPERRIFPTAPTAYRRSLAPRSGDQSAPDERDNGNAEADIPHSHLLYSLHAPPQSRLIQQAGGQIDATATPGSGVVTAAGTLGSYDVAGCRREPPFDGEFQPLGESLIEHIRPTPEWTEDLSLSSDLACAWARLRDDSYGVLHPNNVLILALAGGGAVALRENADERVRRYTARHPDRWGSATDILGELGYINVQLPVLLGTYAWSLHTQDESLHDVSSTMISAFTINGVSTVIIKTAANTSRPSANFNGGRFGFPSYHASSSFTVAGVLDEYYGPRVGIPAYTVAGLIGWSRIDARDHDLSDVLFGSAMGYVIGRSVARHHLVGDSRVQILPWFEPIGGTSGVQLTMIW